MEEDDEEDEDSESDAGEGEGSSAFIWWSLGGMAVVAVGLAVVFGVAN